MAPTLEPRDNRSEPWARSGPLAKLRGVNEGQSATDPDPRGVPLSGIFGKFTPGAEGKRRVAQVPAGSRGRGRPAALPLIPATCPASGAAARVGDSEPPPAARPPRPPLSGPRASFLPRPHQGPCPPARYHVGREARGGCGVGRVLQRAAEAGGRLRREGRRAGVRAERGARRRARQLLAARRRQCRRAVRRARVERQRAGRLVQVALGVGHGGRGARVTPSNGQGARRPPSTPDPGAARRRARGPRAEAGRPAH